MSGFAATWLALREPADARARSNAAVAALAGHLQDATRIVDLGAGTGSNLRWLAPRLAALPRPGRSRGPLQQHWTLLDDDAALLADVPAALASWGQQRQLDPVQGEGHMHLDRNLQVTWRQHDLRADPLPEHGADLVSASAFADLVSTPWLYRLAASCAASRSAVLLALTYDGRVALAPSHAFDVQVRDAVNRHQLGDKGFGPAAGPGAVCAAAGAFAASGFRLRQWRSDWHLTEVAIRRELLAGWHQAAREVLAPQRHDELDDWRAWRLRNLVADTHPWRVGHVDLLALPTR